MWEVVKNSSKLWITRYAYFAVSIQLVSKIISNKKNSMAAKKKVVAKKGKAVAKKGKPATASANFGAKHPKGK